MTERSPETTEGVTLAEHHARRDLAISTILHGINTSDLLAEVIRRDGFSGFIGQTWEHLAVRSHNGLSGLFTVTWKSEA